MQNGQRKSSGGLRFSRLRSPPLPNKPRGSAVIQPLQHRSGAALRRRGNGDKKPLYKRRLPCYSSRNAWAAPGKERIMLSFRLAFSAAEQEQGLVRSIYPDGAAARADKAEDGVGMIR